MYYHKKDRQIVKDIPLTDLIPDGDFIAIFGTSHTRGCCELNNKEVTHIEEDYTWSEIVSKHLGYPCVNFAIPGNTNQVIVQQIVDFLEILDDKSRCKLVLCEVRFGDIAGRYFFDLFADDYHLNELKPRPFLSAGVTTRHWLDEVSGSFVPKLGDDYVESLVRNSTPEFQDYVPKTAVNLLQQIIDAYMKSALSSSELVVNDLLEVRTMRALVEAYNIPFKYFHWDKNKITENSAYYKKIEATIEKMYNLKRSNIKSLMPNVNDAGYNSLGHNTWHESDCECGHKNHIVHAWVADKLIEELKDDFRS